MCGLFFFCYPAPSLPSFFLSLFTFQKPFIQLLLSEAQQHTLWHCRGCFREFILFAPCGSGVRLRSPALCHVRPAEPSHPLAPSISWSCFITLAKVLIIILNKSAEAHLPHSWLKRQCVFVMLGVGLCKHPLLHFHCAWLIDQEKTLELFQAISPPVWWLLLSLSVVLTPVDLPTLHRSRYMLGMEADWSGCMFDLGVFLNTKWFTWIFFENFCAVMAILVVSFTYL